MMMEYRVVLVESEEGFSVSCPALRGCHSQGATLDEALENIKSAIREWSDAESEEKSKLPIIERIVTV
jgi:predicted RNase H-like HicB family nuclease